MLIITEGAPEQAQLLIEENLTASGLCFSVQSQTGEESEEVFLTRDDIWKLVDILRNWGEFIKMRKPDNAEFVGSIHKC